MHCQEEILRAHSAISTSSDAKANDADLNLDSSGKPSGVPPQDLLVVLGESSSVDTRSPSPDAVHQLQWYLRAWKVAQSQQFVDESIVETYRASYNAAKAVRYHSRACFSW